MLRFHQPPPLTLYVHLPWCVQKCPYCDFNSHALRGELPATRYVDALLADADNEATRTAGRRIDSVFFGGGTPSLFPPAEIARLIDGLRQRLNVATDAEVTLEANPGTVEQARFEAFGEAGVNRLSIGIQSFEPAQLKRLGRIHDRDEALKAATAASAAGFRSFNLDLMFGLPEQSLEDAEADVAQAITLEPTHISHYQLTLEPGTAFHARPPRLPDEDRIFDMQQRCQIRLQQAGYGHYEVSAWARPGEECRHNLNYWRFGDYIGLGAGAHGKLTDTEAGQIRRYSKQRMPRQYLAHAGSAAAVAEGYAVAETELALEFMMNALRLIDGVPQALAPARTGLDWAAFAPNVERARAAGLLEVAGDRLWPTEHGQLFLNDLLGCFLPEAA